MDKKIQINLPIGLQRLHTLMLCFAFSFSNAFSMFYAIPSVSTDDVPDSARIAYAELTSHSNIIWNSLFYLNTDSIQHSDSIQLFLDNETINASIVYYNNDNGYYGHYSSIENDVDVYVSIMENNVYGTISAPSGDYYLQSVSPNEIAIIKSGNVIDEEPEINNIDLIDYNNDIENNYSIASSDSSLIRILFLYTDSALQIMGSYLPETTIKQVAFDYINKGNESFDHSNINARFQLAYIGPTNYNESNHLWSTVLLHFSGNTDGYMDEVHELRDKYAADVCVLFQGKDNYCGEARWIKASANTAFCIVHPTGYCNSKFSAVHEIGHLIGCRHDYSSDANIVPYMYGHGYVNYISGDPTNSWRTMMANEDACNDNNYNCRRILYWSTPDVYYNGVAMGSTNLANNARVWNKRAETVATFRNEIEEISYTASDNNLISLFESIKATVEISTSNGFEIQSGQTVEMIAPTILLGAGTHIKSGATFRASTQTDNSTYPQFIKDKGTTSINAFVEKLDTSATKILREGQIHILRGEKTYTLQGVEVK